MMTLKKEDLPNEMDLKFIDITKDFQSLCIEHTNQKKDVYCQNCKELICAHCFIWGRHQNHKVLNKEHIQHSYQKFKENLDNLLKKIQEKVEGSSVDFFSTFLDSQIKKKENYFSQKISSFIEETIKRIKEFQE